MHLNQWRIQDFCEGDAAGAWPPIFFGRDDPHFLWQIVSAHRRSQDFQRVGAPRGGSRISGWGTMDAVGAKRWSAEGVGSGEGRCSPSPVWGSGGIASRKFVKFNLQICAF